MVVASCGGDDSSSEADPTTSSPTTTATTAAPEDTTTTAALTTTTAAPTTTAPAVQPDPAVWVTNGADNRVYKIDPATGDILLEIEVDDPPGGVALGAGSAWVSSSTADYLLRLDVETGEEQARITIGPEGSGVAFSDGVAWVAQFTPGTITAVDPSTDEILRVINVGAGATGMAAGSVWVTTWTDMKLARVEVDFTADTAMVNAVVLFGEGSAPAVGPDYVGATLYNLGEFQVFSADELLPVASFDVGNNANVATYGFGYFWVTNSITGDIYRIDPMDDDAELVTTVPGALGITVGDDMVYVASFSNGVVYQFPPDNPGAMNDLASTGSQAFEIAYGTG
jgi:streptogramin lyase